MIRGIGANDFLLLLSGFQWTFVLSAVAFVGGGIVGILIALTRTSSFKLLQLPAYVYIEIFRGHAGPDAALRLLFRSCAGRA